MDHNKEIVMVRGRKPFICNKFDYSQHSEASKLKDITLEEQKKKFKDKTFAAGCSREIIKKGAEMLGWELDDLINKTIIAMREDPRN